jgi:hypothetical protein
MDEEDMKDLDVDVRFVAPKVLGHPRLWAGMVLANRPWKLFPSLKGAIARRSPRAPTPS